MKPENIAQAFVAPAGRRPAHQASRAMNASWWHSITTFGASDNRM